MALAPGVRLGPYEIVSALGAGGMGEVYKARDTRLDRTVAIKVLPEYVASDPELKQRFEGEARTISSLNHPHICTLHDVGSQDGVDFLVMEHLEGETLAERLTKGALSLDQALRTAIEIADALDKAHRQGIVHRDLKPGNIMLTKTGAKLLDFGLAKLRPPGAPGAVGLTEAPTVSSPLTGTGSILGTFQYMAPEQLEGREADARTDIFAFGAVVYEMVTGKRAFEGKSQASLISAIMSSEPPPMGQLQPVTPPALDRLVGVCLAKFPDDRWQTARDLHRELRWVLDQPALPVGTLSASAARAAANWRRVAPAALLALVLGAVATAAVLRLGTEAQAPALVTHVEVARTPAASSGGNPQVPKIAISPDGRTMAFRGRLADGDTDFIFVRPLDAEGATALPGSGSNTTFGPVFSPDGTWIAYRSREEIFKVPVSGGRPTSLVRLPRLFISPGLSWSADDWRVRQT